jgi:hypothetical protein
LAFQLRAGVSTQLETLRAPAAARLLSNNSMPGAHAPPAVVVGAARDLRQRGNAAFKVRNICAQQNVRVVAAS